MPVTTSHINNDENTTVDQSEIDHFSSLAKEWWNPTGKFKPLHKFNPIRLQYIKEKLCTHFERDPKAPEALKGLKILDIGCGGGLLSEPVAKMGAKVVGADAGAVNIEVAKLHAAQNNIDIDYQTTTAEELAASGAQFDVVLNMEVIEHVADVDLFLNACATMVRPGGLMLVATINRTLKARTFAIFMAEQVLRWLPKGTHQFEKLVKPVEISGPLILNGMEIVEQLGVSYNPIADNWHRSKDMSVNYMILAQRPA